MNRTMTVALSALILHGAAAGAQAPAAATQAFETGRPLGTTGDGGYQPMSKNVKVFGSVVSAESCSYDATRNLIVVPNRGAEQTQVPNDGFVSLLNPDGSVHTPRWIGATRAGLTLNQPFGSEIRNDTLYLADSDGGTADGAKRVAVIRMFDMKTGAPTGEIKVPDAAWLNDLAVADDGTIYASQTGSADGATPMRIWKVSPPGAPSILIEGAPLSLPNGVALDRKGNLVVANMGNAAVMTFTPDGKMLGTEQAAVSGSDGLVILSDGTKYLSSVRLGGVSRIRPGKAAELIASGIPSAASMCFDPKQRQLVIPMNSNNALAFIKL